MVALPNPGVLKSVFPILPCEGVEQELDLNTLLDGEDSGGWWEFEECDRWQHVISSIMCYQQAINVFTYTRSTIHFVSEQMVEVIVELGLPT